MDSNKSLLTQTLAISILVLNNFSGLIFSPYKVMRKISHVFDHKQVMLIFFLVFAYFYSVSFMFGHNILNFLYFLGSFFLTIVFFYGSGRLCRYQVSLSSLISTWSYGLLPTLLWFFLTAILFALFPPPRTQSLMGTVLSILFVGISVSLLLWKITLIYLAIRFSLKTNAIMTGFFMIIYGVWFLPYTYALYFFSISRVPFI
ncbi:MAG: hypothetical protein WBO77_05090 [Microgenomates group bacterium]